MIVDWRPRAVRRLDKIHAHTSEGRFLAADAVFDTIVAAAATLPSHPYAYREGRVPNARDGQLPNYIIVYRVKRDRILIVNVLHARQCYP
ncbi:MULTISPECIES: type II toxin-antitoxin system RelE/ParE family toxin [unclassified Caballeronia]|uniref:type II toxin-antitoxin system RelE/ParE family toxin n=1 Tax=unclassified Caballeronia TaxID=2646786 RepID=UPI0028573DAE|nr:MULTISPECIES: type II toxin-antitoxin system RelE/ParE family toxin [unclassified Caballeronia]MDR5740022.1 type II toxin-antitoxin system RelE/ParE family toxin [Caballeronia sp. LZ016]MDR5809157.1 type II toxin-antitoxin system RelE/ParE family toxin [Caballeronia sp. LZ019]